MAAALEEPAPGDGGWHSRAVAVDPARWELVRFTLWDAVPDRVPGGATAFDVLHASTPCLEQLRRGRLW